MNIKINIVELSSELADRDLILSYGDEGGKNRFPNGIVKFIDEYEDITEYTDEAQDFFNERYDYWWDYLYNIKINDDENRM